MEPFKEEPYVPTTLKDIAVPSLVKIFGSFTVGCAVLIGLGHISPDPFFGTAARGVGMVVGIVMFIMTLISIQLEAHTQAKAIAWLAEHNATWEARHNAHQARLRRLHEGRFGR